MKLSRLARKGILVVVLGVAAQLSARPASAASTFGLTGCGYCGDSCWDLLFGCAVGCQAGGNGCTGQCIGESGTIWPHGMDCG